MKKRKAEKKLKIMKNPMVFKKTLLAIGIVGLLALALSSSNLWGPDAAQAATVGPPSQLMAVPDGTALVGENSIRIARNATVNGNILVNQDGSPPFADAGNSVEDLAFGKATVNGNLTADSMELSRAADVNGSLFTNELDDRGADCDPDPPGDCVIAGPYTAGTVSPLPTLGTASPGTDDLIVAAGDTVTVPDPAVIDQCDEFNPQFCVGHNFRDIVLGQNATLIFLGGTYNAESVAGGQSSSLLFMAPGELLVAGTFDMGRNSTVGPAATSGISASEIVIQVEGLNGGGGAPADSPAAASIGRDGFADANFLVPNATFRADVGQTFTGSAVALNIRIETGATVHEDSAFTNQPPVANPGSVETFVDETGGVQPVGITLTGFDPEGSDLVFSIVDDPDKGELSLITQINGTTASVTYTPDDPDTPDFFTFKVTEVIPPSMLGAMSSAAVVLINDPDGSELPRRPTEVDAFDIPSDSLTGCAPGDPLDPCLSTAIGAPVGVGLVASAPCDTIVDPPVPPPPAIIEPCSIIPAEIVEIEFSMDDLPDNGILTDPDGDPVSTGVLDFAGCTSGTPGTFESALGCGPSLVYTPDTNPDFTGTDELTFAACADFTGTVTGSTFDQPEECDTAIVKILVTAPFDLAGPDITFNTEEGTPIGFQVIANPGGAGVPPPPPLSAGPTVVGLNAGCDPDSVVAWIGAETEFPLSQAVASGDAFEHRPSERGHCVQDFSTELDLRDLPGEAAEFEFGADDALPTAHLRFYSAALVVPCCRLPGHAAVAADLGNMAIPNGRITRRLQADHCVLWRRYDHIQGLPIPLPQQISCGRSIVGAVSQKARDRGIQLIQEAG